MLRSSAVRCERSVRVAGDIQNLHIRVCSNGRSPGEFNRADVKSLPLFTHHSARARHRLRRHVVAVLTHIRSANLPTESSSSTTRRRGRLVVIPTSLHRLWLLGTHLVTQPATINAGSKPPSTDSWSALDGRRCRQ